MKRLLLAVFACLLFSFSNTQAQELGIRVGEVLGKDFAVDGVFSTGKFNRVHANLSINDGNVFAEVLWDFIYKPIGDKGLHWYAGAGPFVGLGDDFQFGAVTELGLEYRFGGAPLVLGLDWRPTFQIIDETNSSTDFYGVNFRYIF